MHSFYGKQKFKLPSRIVAFFTILAFSSSLIIFPSKMVHAQSALNLPVPGTMVTMSAGFAPPIIRGLTLYPDNPLRFDFIVDTGDNNLGGTEFEQESTKLIKYFLAALTVPEDEFWVNLSPYEKDRIIPDGLGVTELGRDLLAQDYLLKQITASLMYPEENLGNEFWQRVYDKAQRLYGTSEIPVNTFNKVWIVPDKAVVYEHNGGAFVGERHLKVMLEEDYIALKSNMESEDIGTDQLTKDDVEALSGVTSEVVREVLIPELEKEVNEGSNFANLRQIFNSMILATWYKKNLRETLLGQVYMDQNKVKGVDVEDKTVKQQIYDQYLEAFKKGVYNYIKEDYDPATQEIIPRKYFSGGVAPGVVRVQSLETRQLDEESPDAAVEIVGPESEKGSLRRVTTDLLENTDDGQFGLAKATSSQGRRIIPHSLTRQRSRQKIVEGRVVDFVRGGQALQLNLEEDQEVATETSADANYQALNQRVQTVFELIDSFRSQVEAGEIPEALSDFLTDEYVSQNDLSNQTLALLFSRVLDSRLRMVKGEYYVDVIDGDLIILSHAGRGLQTQFGGPRVWMGEKAFESLSDIEIIKLMLEEGLHILRPNGKHGDNVNHNTMFLSGVRYKLKAAARLQASKEISKPSTPTRIGWSRDISEESPDVAVPGGEELAEEVASKLHEQWKTDFRAKNGPDAPRWKAAKNAEFEARVKAELGATGATVNEAGNVRINDEGNVEIDIAHMNYRQLTESWQAENRAAAQDGVAALEMAAEAGVSEEDLRETLNEAVERLEAGQTLDETFVAGNAARQVVMQAGNLIHDSWLQRNGSWAPEEQKLPFGQLDANNQKLDLNILKIALDTIEESPDAAVDLAMLSEQQAARQLNEFIQGPNGYRLESKLGSDRLERARPIAVELLRELHGKPLDYTIFDTTFTKGDITTAKEVALNELKDEVGRVELSTFMQVVFLRLLGIVQRPSSSVEESPDAVVSTQAEVVRSAPEQLKTLTVRIEEALRLSNTEEANRLREEQVETAVQYAQSTLNPFMAYVVERYIRHTNPTDLQQNILQGGESAIAEIERIRDISRFARQNLATSWVESPDRRLTHDAEEARELLRRVLRGNSKFYNEDERKLSTTSQYWAPEAEMVQERKASSENWRQAENVEQVIAEAQSLEESLGELLSLVARQAGLAEEDREISKRVKSVTSTQGKISKFRDSGEEWAKEATVADVFDLLGGRIVVSDLDALERLMVKIEELLGFKIERNAQGELQVSKDSLILRKENKFLSNENRDDPYRAVQYTIRLDRDKLQELFERAGIHPKIPEGIDISQHTFELQIKTRRASTASDLFHDAVYKDILQLVPELQKIVGDYNWNSLYEDVVTFARKRRIEIEARDPELTRITETVESYVDSENVRPESRAKLVKAITESILNSDENRFFDLVLSRYNAQDALPQHVKDIIQLMFNRQLEKLKAVKQEDSTSVLPLESAAHNGYMIGAVNRELEPDRTQFGWQLSEEARSLLPAEGLQAYNDRFENFQKGNKLSVEDLRLHQLDGEQLTRFFRSSGKQIDTVKLNGLFGTIVDRGLEGDQLKDFIKEQGLTRVEELLLNIMLRRSNTDDDIAWRKNTKIMNLFHASLPEQIEAADLIRDAQIRQAWLDRLSTNQLGTVTSASLLTEIVHAPVQDADGNVVTVQDEETGEETVVMRDLSEPVVTTESGEQFTRREMMVFWLFISAINPNSEFANRSYNDFIKSEDSAWAREIDGIMDREVVKALVTGQLGTLRERIVESRDNPVNIARDQDIRRELLEKYFRSMFKNQNLIHRLVEYFGGQFNEQTSALVRGNGEMTEAQERIVGLAQRANEQRAAETERLYQKLSTNLNTDGQRRIARELTPVIGSMDMTDRDIDEVAKIIKEEVADAAMLTQEDLLDMVRRYVGTGTELMRFEKAPVFFWKIPQSVNSLEDMPIEIQTWIKNAKDYKPGYLSEDSELLKQAKAEGGSIVIQWGAGVVEAYLPKMKAQRSYQRITTESIETDKPELVTSTQSTSLFDQLIPMAIPKGTDVRLAIRAGELGIAGVDIQAPLSWGDPKAIQGATPNGNDYIIVSMEGDEIVELYMVNENPGDGHLPISYIPINPYTKNKVAQTSIGADSMGAEESPDAVVPGGGEELAEEVASKLHEQWKADFRAKNGPDAPRWKAAKNAEFETRVKAELGDTGAIVNEARNIRINDKGNVEIDIAHMNYRELTESWQAENKAAAQDGVVALEMAAEAGVAERDLREALDEAVERLEAGQTLDETFVAGNAARQVVVQAGELIHNAWLQRNGSWAPEEQKLPFGQLDANNQKLDLNILLVAIETKSGLWDQQKVSEVVDKLDVVTRIRTRLQAQGVAVILGAPGTGKTEQLELALGRQRAQAVNLRDLFFESQIRDRMDWDAFSARYKTDADLKREERDWLTSNLGSLEARLMSDDREVVIFDEFDLAIREQLEGAEVETADVILELARRVRSQGKKVVVILHSKGMRTPGLAQAVEIALFESGENLDSELVRTGYLSRETEQEILALMGIEGEEAESFLDSTDGIATAYLGFFVHAAESLREGGSKEGYQISVSELRVNAETQIAKNYRVAALTVGAEIAGLLRDIATGAKSVADSDVVSNESRLLDTGLVRKKNGELVMPSIVKSVVSGLEEESPDAAVSSDKISPEEFREVNNLRTSLMERVTSLGLSQADLTQINRALDILFAKQLHQKRKTGAVYVLHPMEVAVNLIQDLGKTDTHLIIAAILHDVVEDTDITIENIQGVFGSEVARVVKGVTIDEADPDYFAGMSKQEKEIEKIRIYQRNVLNAVQGDDEVFYIKILDLETNALALSNLSDQQEVQSRLANKYLRLVQEFARKARELGLDKKASQYEAAISEVEGYARNWEFSEALNAEESPDAAVLGGEELAEEVASKLHEQWKTDFRAKNGPDAPRWKAAKNAEFEARVKAELGAKGTTINETGNVRINDEGNVEIDIAHMNYRQLTESWQAENKAAAQDGVAALEMAAEVGVSEEDLREALDEAVKRLEAGQTLDETFVAGNTARQVVTQAGDLIHNAWLQRNGSWAPAEQKSPFAQLDANNQKLDLNILNVTLNTSEESPDAVVFVQSNVSTTQSKPDKVGGIDLNPAMLDLQIKRDGNGIPLPAFQQPIQNMKIDGFLPVIINVAPVSIPMLLGDADQPENTKQQLSLAQ